MAFSLSTFATINPGELIIAGFEETTGGGAVQELMFIALAPIDAGEVVYVTDGSIATTAPFNVTLGSKDETLTFTIGSNGIPAGSVFVIGSMATATPSIVAARSNVTASDITSISNSAGWDFEFGTNGDDFFVFQGSAATATSFVYAVGVGTSGSQLNPATPANVTAIATWGLESQRTANYFNFGNANYKMLAANPSNINFGGTIDDALAGLSNSANYITDDSQVLNDNSGGTDLRIGSITPQPSNRYWNGTNWYRDDAFTDQTTDPNRTHATVFTTSSYNTNTNGNLDVAEIVVGDGTNANTFTLTSTGSIQTVYGLQVSTNSTMTVAAGGTFDLGDTLVVKTTGTLTTEAGSSLNVGGNITVDGTVTLGASSSGTTDLILDGSSTQSISGSGTINAQVYVSSDGWTYVSAPGSITWDKVTGITKNFTDDGKTRAQANIWSWDAGESGWYPAKSSGNFGDSAYAVYVFAGDVGNTLNLAYVADNFDAGITNDEDTYTVKYHAPTGNPVNSSTGWVSGDHTTNAGWQLVKNPYWAPITWQVVDDALPSGVGATVYMFNSSSDSWETWVSGDASTVYDDLPKLAAYFVQVTNTANNQGLKRGKGAKISSTRKVLKTSSVHSEVKPQVRFDIGISGQYEDTKIFFDDNATADFDLSYDAHYRGAGPSGLYFGNVSTDSISLKINQVPTPTATDAYFLTLDAPFDGESGVITTDVTFMPAGMNVFIEDLYENTYTDVSMGQSVTFTYSDNAPKQRFKVHFTNVNIGLEEAAGEEVLSVYADANGNLVFDETQIDADSKLEVVDLSGRLILTSEDLIGKQVSTHHLPAGVYVLKVSNGSSTLATKIILQ
ncbi:MAG: hypothetical protein SchgKO_02590 [Schleiferiaceae bacterium]